MNTGAHSCLDAGKGAVMMGSGDEYGIVPNIEISISDKNMIRIALGRGA